MKNTDKTPECLHCFISSDIFKHLTRDELDILAYVKSCNYHSRGDVIYHEGNHVSGIYCVSKGIIKHFKTGVDGKEQIVRFSKKGSIFGFRSILSEEPACTSTKVIEDASICYIPVDKFLEWVKNNSEFAMQIMKMSCKELGEANQYIINIAQRSVRERLAEVLLLLEENFGTNKDGELNISLTRDELAGLVGTATESVIRLLSEFKSDKLIELNRRKIRIIDAKKLKAVYDFR